MNVIKFFLIVGFFIIFSKDGFAQERKVNWESFSVNLVKALDTKNDGLQQSAMGLIIRYADSLDVIQHKRAAFQAALSKVCVENLCT